MGPEAAPLSLHGTLSLICQYGTTSRPERFQTTVVYGNNLVELQRANQRPNPGTAPDYGWFTGAWSDYSGTLELKGIRQMAPPCRKVKGLGGHRELKGGS
jgi:hypothetical protein